MFQNKTAKIVFILTLISLFNFSCAKKPSGIRVVRQTESQAINKDLSDSSIKAANEQNAYYQITLIDRPDKSENGVFIVTSEIKTPDNKFIPIKATHDGKDENGMIQNGTDQILIQSRCMGDSCSPYVMLVTVIKGGYAVHQSFAISNSNEDIFHVEDKNYSVDTSFYKTLDQAVIHFGLK